MMTQKTEGNEVRHDWSVEEVEALFELPLLDLLFRAQTLQRAHFEPNRVQVSTLLSIKTGACPEDCSYCSQSARHDSGLERERLLDVAAVVEQARIAHESGATRFCMGAAWRSPRERDFPAVLEMVERVGALGLETCVTLGMLSEAQAGQLKQAGLDYYNHNLDTSPEHYPNVVTTRSFDDRLQTLAHVREAGLKICCGGIVGMGESRRDRAALIVALANLPQQPESVPVNRLVRIPGTPLADAPDLDDFEFVRTVAVARITMPASWVRLSAGREAMDDALQALCFAAGANSIFSGERLLTTGNIAPGRDQALFARLGIEPVDSGDRRCAEPASADAAATA